MSQINPQYTFDDYGNPVGVFLPINEWNSLINNGVIELPEWQKNLIDSRIKEFNANPETTIAWENILSEMEAEDEKV